MAGPVEQKVPEPGVNTPAPVKEAGSSASDFADRMARAAEQASKSPSPGEAGPGSAGYVSPEQKQANALKALEGSPAVGAFGSTQGLTPKQAADTLARYQANPNAGEFSTLDASTKSMMDSAIRRESGGQGMVGIEYGGKSYFVSQEEAKRIASNQGKEEGTFNVLKDLGLIGQKVEFKSQATIEKAQKAFAPYFNPETGKYDVVSALAGEKGRPVTPSYFDYLFPKGTLSASRAELPAYQARKEVSSITGGTGSITSEQVSKYLASGGSKETLVSGGVPAAFIDDVVAKNAAKQALSPFYTPEEKLQPGFYGPARPAGYLLADAVQSKDPKVSAALSMFFTPEQLQAARSTSSPIANTPLAPAKTGVSMGAYTPTSKNPLQSFADFFRGITKPTKEEYAARYAGVDKQPGEVGVRLLDVKWMGSPQSPLVRGTRTAPIIGPAVETYSQREFLSPIQQVVGYGSSVLQAAAIVLPPVIGRLSSGGSISSTFQAGRTVRLPSSVEGIPIKPGMVVIEESPGVVRPFTHRGMAYTISEGQITPAGSLQTGRGAQASLPSWERLEQAFAKGKVTSAAQTRMENVVSTIKSEGLAPIPIKGSTSSGISGFFEPMERFLITKKAGFEVTPQMGKQGWWFGKPSASSPAAEVIQSPAVSYKGALKPSTTFIPAANALPSPSPVVAGKGTVNVLPSPSTALVVRSTALTAPITSMVASGAPVGAYMGSPSFNPLAMGFAIPTPRTMTFPSLVETPMPSNIPSIVSSPIPAVAVVASPIPTATPIPAPIPVSTPIPATTPAPISNTITTPFALPRMPIALGGSGGGGGGGSFVPRGEKGKWTSMEARFWVPGAARGVPVFAPVSYGTSAPKSSSKVYKAKMSRLS